MHTFHYPIKSISSTITATESSKNTINRIESPIVERETEDTPIETELRGRRSFLKRFGESVDE